MKAVLATAALSLVLAAGPSFAADPDGGGSQKNQQDQQSVSKTPSHRWGDECANILANPNAYSAAAVRNCRSKLH